MQYPPLKATDLVPFQRIQAAIAADPTYLASPDCTYPPEVRDFLRSLSPLSAVLAAETVFLGAESDRYEVITTQIDLIYKELNDLKVSDPGERIQIAKAKAQLLEKLVLLHERTLGLKQTSDFKKVVIAAVDALSVIDRDAFLKKLEGAA